jgi:glutathione S-transferase
LTSSIASVALSLRKRRLAHEGGFRLDDYPSLRRWIGAAERCLRLPPVPR